MQKRVTIITIVIMAILLIGTAVGVIAVVNSGFSSKTAKLTSDIQDVQSKLDALNAAKDINGFTPTEVVKAFFAEVQSDATERAKLYLAPEVQNMDTKATLKLGSDLANVTTGDSFEEDQGTDKLVNMAFVFSVNDAPVRTFSLSKYNDAWKITGVTAE